MAEIQRYASMKRGDLYNCRPVKYWGIDQRTKNREREFMTYLLRILMSLFHSWLHLIMQTNNGLSGTIGNKVVGDRKHLWDADLMNVDQIRLLRLLNGQVLLQPKEPMNLNPKTLDLKQKNFSNSKLNKLVIKSFFEFCHYKACKPLMNQSSIP